MTVTDLETLDDTDTMHNTLPSYMLTPRMLANRARAAKRAERLETVKAGAAILALFALMLAAGYFCPPVSVSF